MVFARGRVQRVWMEQERRPCDDVFRAPRIVQTHTHTHVEGATHYRYPSRPTCLSVVQLKLLRVAHRHRFPMQRKDESTRATTCVKHELRNSYSKGFSGHPSIQLPMWGRETQQTAVSSAIIAVALNLTMNEWPIEFDST